jgi:hypothetical protein
MAVSMMELHLWIAKDSRSTPKLSIDGHHVQKKLSQEKRRREIPKLLTVMYKRNGRGDFK